METYFAKYPTDKKISTLFMKEMNVFNQSILKLVLYLFSLAIKIRGATAKCNHEILKQRSKHGKYSV